MPTLTAATKTLAAYKLPVPPSANKLWRVYQGRAIKSREYRAWEVEAGLSLRMQRIARVPSPYAVRIVIMAGKDWNMRRDCDNSIKPLVDAIRHAGVVEDDNSRHLVDLSIRIERHEGPESWCCVEVESM